MKIINTSIGKTKRDTFQEFALFFHNKTRIITYKFVEMAFNIIFMFTVKIYFQCRWSVEQRYCSFF